MEKRLRSDITIKDLRQLREAYRNLLGDELTVCITIDLWHFQEAIGGETEEVLVIWWSNSSDTREFYSLEEAYEYLEKMKKGEEV